MGVYRTLVALGALAVSVPVGAQGSRSATERSRVERGRVERRGEAQPDNRIAGKNDGKNDRRDDGRDDGGNKAPNSPKADDRDNGASGNGSYGPGDNRTYNPGDNRTHRMGRRDEPRGDPRGRPDIRIYRGDARLDHRNSRYDGRVIYRYDARDFRRYDVPRITVWFRNRGMMHAPAYGRRDRYDFRPGIYLSTILIARLDVLPFDLELELGALPWYLERRIYGRTVLIIDTRTRLLVDVYDVDW